MSDEPRERAKRLTVRVLNRLCELVDEVAYRPAVVKLTLRLPRWWRCDLARLATRLDERWPTGRCSDGAAPAVFAELVVAAPLGLRSSGRRRV
jgi:hypothetical protein